MSMPPTRKSKFPVSFAKLTTFHALVNLDGYRVEQCPTQEQEGSAGGLGVVDLEGGGRRQRSLRKRQRSQWIREGRLEQGGGAGRAAAAVAADRRLPQPEGLRQAARRRPRTGEY